MLALEIALEGDDHGIDQRLLAAHLGLEEPSGIVAHLASAQELAHCLRNGHELFI
jgi:hypothetical protein